MNRQEFIHQLEVELQDLPNEERIAALQYFTMYFDDAGPEHEQDVIIELGDPKKIAKDIKSSAGYDFSETWVPPAQEFTGQNNATSAQNTLNNNPQMPFQNSPFAPPVPPEQPNYLPPNSTYSGNYNQTYTQTNTGKADNTTLKIILLIVLSPLWLSLLGIVLGLFVSIVVILAVPLIIGVSFIITGIAAAAGSIYLITISLGNGLLTLGICLILIGAGLLVSWVGILLLKTVVPACAKGISHLFSAIFGKKEVVQ